MYSFTLSLEAVILNATNLLSVDGETSISLPGLLVLTANVADAEPTVNNAPTGVVWVIGADVNESTAVISFNPNWNVPALNASAKSTFTCIFTGVPWTICLLKLSKVMVIPLIVFDCWATPLM